MRSSGRRWSIAVAGLLAASSCAHDAPFAPSQPSGSPLTLIAITLDVPPVIFLGSAAVSARAQAIAFDGSFGSFVPISQVKCTPVWKSSAPSVATVSPGVVEARAIGDTTIEVTCRDLRGESKVRVRRRLTGTVVAGPTNQPIADAVVSVVTGPDSGTETRTDLEGRFALAVPAEFELRARAEAFESVRQRVDVIQETVRLTLQPLEAQPPLSFRWEGWFERPSGSSSATRFPQGTLDGFEFETHFAGEFSLALSTTCNTNGTYDDFTISIYGEKSAPGLPELAVWSTNPTKVGRQSKTLPAGVYRVVLPATNSYARPPCTWWAEVTRPY